MHESAGMTVLVAHHCPLISAGLVSILGGIPECRVRPVERQTTDGDCWIGAGKLVVADEAFAASLVDALAAIELSSRPKLMMMTEGHRKSPASGIAFPDAVDHCLSIRCPESELLDIARSLLGLTPRRAKPSPRGGMAPGALSRVREVMHNRMAEQFDARDLARIAGLSECHFARAFKQSVGLPPHRYLLSLRVKAAADMIRDTRRSLTEVSLEVGFADQSHFTRTFVRQMGETPSSFRLRHR